MRKAITIFVAIVAVLVIFIFFKNFRIAGLGQVSVEPRFPTGNSLLAKAKQHFTAKPISDSESNTSDANGNLAVVDGRTQTKIQGRRTIRVATFNLGSWNATKSRKPSVVEIVARMISQYDVIAVQEIQSSTDDPLPRLVDQMNKLGGEFDFAIGPRLGKRTATEQYGFIFNRKTVELDRTELYTVYDKDDRLTREPFVGWFRTRAVRADRAFTFSLVNCHIDRSRLKQELDAMDEVLFSVRDDGREEDDVLLVGDFGPNYRETGQLGRLTSIRWAINGLPTTTDGQGSVDNIVFQKRATIEFTGRSGTFNFLQKYNLALDHALEISNHLPVWAEFSVFEGGQPGRLATRDEQSIR